MILKSLLCLGLVAGEALANCRVGPSYWCASIPQAVQCSALPFCIQAVWTKEAVAKDTDEVCDICKNMVGEARDTLQSNETQDELRQVFEGSCDLIPLKPIRKECKVLADEFVPELVETLSSEMNPDTVCTVAGLCNSERIDKMLHKYYAKTGYCQTCRTQMFNANTILSAADDSMMEAQLFQICGQLGSYSDACVSTVSSQLPVIRSMLEAAISPDSCTKEVCSAKDLVSTKYNEDVECEFCTKVVKHWIDVYASDSSLQEFKQILEGLCDRVDKSRAAHCKHIVDDYYMPLFEYIKRVDPHMICSMVGICRSNGLDSYNQALPLSTLFPEEKSVPYTPLESAQQVDVAANAGKSSCLLCEFAMQKIETFLQDKKNAAEIKDYIDGLCDDVPGSYKDACKSFVDAYEPVIIEMLADEIHPSQICKSLQLCAAPAPIPPKQSTSCETCRIVTEEVFSVFTSKDDQDMVRNVLESICYRFPEYVDEPCEQFVDTYATAFLDFIAKSLSPEELCDALDMCSAGDDLSIDLYGIANNEDQSDDSACVICEYVVSYLDKALKDKTNEAEIKQALDEVCDVLPGNVRKQCESFVDAYTDMIIQLLTGEVTPKEVCGYLGLCQNDVYEFQPVLGPMVSPLEATNGPYCTMCEYLINTVDQMVQDKQTEKEIEVSLDKVCYVLPYSVKGKCLELVRDYTDQIIHLLVNDYPADQVCGKLKLCYQY